MESHWFTLTGVLQPVGDPVNKQYLVPEMSQCCAKGWRWIRSMNTADEQQRGFLLSPLQVGPHCLQTLLILLTITNQLWAQSSHMLLWVQFSRSVLSDFLQPHESQHARPPCPSQTPGVHSDSCPSSRWCHPAISSSVVPFSSCPQSLPASESFPMSQLFAWGGQSTGVSALASVLPMNTQDWSPLEWTGWISLQSKGLCK